MSELRVEQSSHKVAASAVVIAFVLVCLNLRIVFGGVGPLIPYMQLSPAVASVLTASPPLCMGLFAPLGTIASRRLGDERALFLAMIVVTIGILVRSSSIPGLLLGTIISSAGIAVLNVLTPVFVRRRFAPQRIGTMMGFYAMMMGGGGGVMAALAVPFYGAFNDSWSLSLAMAAIPAVLAVLALVPLLGPSTQATQAVQQHQWHTLLRHRIAWSIIGFFGIQSLIFYTILAWLPAIYIAKGADPTAAGLYLALCIFAVAAGGFFGPTFAARKNDHRIHVIASIALCFVGIAGIMLMPLGTAPLWVLILGLGMGAGQGIPGVLYSKRTTSHPQMTQLSGMVQTIGYLIAATGPAIAATLHNLSGAWTWPLAVLLVLLVFNGFVSLHGGRDHVID